MAFTFRSSQHSRSKDRPRVPKGVRIYAIGDIHGRADLLSEALQRIDSSLAKSPVANPIQIFLGDYIDRGPASREVLDQLIKRGRAHRSVFLKGNHETYMGAFVENPTVLRDWRHLGGLQTLLSYKVIPSLSSDAATETSLAMKFSRALPANHREFLGSLKSSFICGDYFFAHAGVRPGVPLTAQREEDLLWIREDFLFCEESFSKMIVHGHTPVASPDIRPNRINIDTGAYATGRLTCLVLEDDKFHFI